MLKNIWIHVHQWFVPSNHNNFHPHLIAERGLLILFALILGAEAFLVSNVLSLQTGAPSLAAVGFVTTETTLPPILAQAAEVWMRYIIAPLGVMAMQPNAGKIALLGLISIAALLMGLLALTLAVRHSHFKPVGYVAGGTMLAFVSTLLFFDTHVLLPYMAENQMARVAVPVAEVSFRVGSEAAASTTAWTFDR